MMRNTDRPMGGFQNIIFLKYVSMYSQNNNTCTYLPPFFMLPVLHGICNRGLLMEKGDPIGPSREVLQGANLFPPKISFTC